MSVKRKILVLQVAGLGAEFLKERQSNMRLAGLEFEPMETVFPAVTCTVQASFRTARYADEHGMVANGFYSREFHKAYFWEQSSDLIKGKRIWADFRQNGGTVGQMFWQQSLGQDSDVLLSPAPIHKHGGGMIQDCFSRPSGLYEYLCGRIGSRFNLINYWGPFASHKSSRWITRATAEVMASEWAPDLLLSYLPHLDYALQKSGPGSAASEKAFAVLAGFMEELMEAADRTGYGVLVFGDYGIVPVSRAVLPNQILLEAGLMNTRRIDGMLYSDHHTSRAFAVVDHQVAHVICTDDAAESKAREILEGTPGVASVLGRGEQKEFHINHHRSGELVLIADSDAWFAYPWWRGKADAPDYARHVDIHNKPGYDPCELFYDFLPTRVSLDPSQINGSHGIIDGRPQAVSATDLDLDGPRSSLLMLSTALKRFLNNGGLS